MSSSYIGKVIDNYRIIQQLGIGGMGVVFKAVHIKLDKVVALKMIAPGLAMNERFIKRFETEAKALAKLEDINIVKIYDLRHENDQWFIVMEYIEGITLTEKIKNEGALSTEHAIPILRQILTSIGHAHEEGIIHRDIKPNNVMICNDGKIKITDFGLAKDQQSGAHTMTISSGGTLFYMSPEHVKGFAFTDHRSDIYSIGMTAYEMLTGKVPFNHGETDFGIREKIMRKEFPSMRKMQADIPKELDKIILKSIAKSPAKRYQSTAEMLADLSLIYPSDTAVAGKPVVVQQSNRIKRPLITVLSSVSVIIAAIMFFLFIGHNGAKSELVSENNANAANKTPPADTMKTDLSKQANVSNVIPEDTTRNNAINEPAPEILKPVAKAEGVRPEKKETSVISAASVSIQSEPDGVTIWSEGRIIGRTPFTVSSMESGSREFIFKKEGYKELNQTFDIKANRQNEFNVTMTEAAATASIISVPDDAIVFLDGKELPGLRTPVQLEEISPGSHSLIIKKSGYADAQQNIEVNREGNNVFQLDLKQLSGKLEVLVKPWGSIYIDGNLKKENTKIKYTETMPAKDYTILVIHPTMGRFEKKISIAGNQTYDLTVDFSQTYPMGIKTVNKNGEEVRARILVDGVDADAETPAEIPLRTGIHTIECKSNGNSVTKKILVDDKSPKTIQLTLDLP